jgi:polysaccharide export outer membrane protein
MICGCATVPQEGAPAPEIEAAIEDLPDAMEENRPRIFSPKEENSPQIKEIQPGDYRFKVGDKIEISVWGEKDMTRQVVVQPDGKVGYFLMGEIRAVDQTFKELRTELEKGLSKYIRNPRVTIIGMEFAGNYATILGAVMKPGRHIISRTDRVLDLLAASGGFRYMDSDDTAFAGDFSDLKAAYLSRNGQIVDVDFVTLIKDGDMAQNAPIEVGDFIYIPSSTSQLIFVLGEVERARAIPFRGRTTLLEALASAGGFDERTACKRSICIVRGSLKNPTVIMANFPRILSGKDKNVVLDPGDIVYVPSTFITEVERLSRKIIPFLDVVLKGDATRDIFKGDKSSWYRD